MTVLEKVNFPEDLKDLSIEDLELLCAELRKFIVDVVSRTGGHLASSLGVVELTVALLKVFSPPRDAIVFDVGHQSYAYKILTGRKDRFHTLRQYGGISGFPSIAESAYDAFGTGHSSTSISAALGIEMARKLKGEGGRAIAVIGDGAMTAGEAYEGLNNAGQLDDDLIVVLNDNEMSISRNIGAISNYLVRITTGQTVRRVKERLEGVVKKVFGERVYKRLKRVEDLIIKGLFPPGMLFEELGFRYIGPVDGHNIKMLVNTLSSVSLMKGPVLIHVLTKKGKGYKPAEENPDIFHGVSPGSKSGRKEIPTYTEVFSNALVRIAEQDSRMIAITAAMPSGTGLDKFKEKFPDRYFDVGIAEQHAVTFAAGLAKEGLKPVVAIYSTFLQRAFDQIVHDVALQKLPVVFAIDRAGLVGEDGPTHHGVFDISYLRLIPNMVVSAPKDEKELADLLFTAIKSDVPFSLRYPRGAACGVDYSGEPAVIPVGSWEVLRDGREIALIATGWEVYQCLRAADELREGGFDVAVLNARFIKPVDKDLLSWAGDNFRHIVTVEEGSVIGGLGCAVRSFLSDADVKVYSLGIPDEFVEHGNQAALREKLKLDSRGIKSFLLSLMK